MRIPIGLAAAVVVLVMAVAGCGSSATTSPSVGPTAAPPSLAASATPSPAPSVTVAPRPSPSTSSAAGAADMHVTMPPGWQTVEMTEAALRNMASVMGASNPQLAATLEQLLSSGAYKSIQFFGIGFDGADVIGNVNGIAESIGGFDLDGAAPFIEAQYKNVGATDITTRRATLPAGEALIIDLTLPVNVGGTSRKFHDRVYAVLKDGTLYTTTVTCSAADPTGCLKDADQIARSLTIGG